VVTLVALVVAVGVVAVSARVSVSVPGSPVPQSLQTLGVVLVGAGLGWLRGGAALVLYLLVGAVGVPVFADGAAGAAHLVGPTAGYLMGFVLAAAWVGWGVERTCFAAMSPAHSSESPALDPARTGSLFARAFLVMVLGHVLILGLGWLRLALEYGTIGGYEAGVLPFLWGGVAKSAVGAAGWAAWTARTARMVGTARMSRTSRTAWMPSPTRDIPMNPRPKANE